MLMPPLPWHRARVHDNGGDWVVLLHGLWRSWHAMEPMARALRQAGFSTISLSYASFRHSFPRILDLVKGAVESHHAGRTVHFVGHSMGCVVARLLLEGRPDWRCGRLVMLAAPNAGSEIVDHLRHHAWFRFIMGPGGCELGSDGILTRLNCPQVASAVIMGRLAAVPFFRKWLDADNDGIVSVKNGRIEGVERFAVVDADHTFIQAHPEVQRMTVRFLASGEWRDDLANSR